MSRQLELPLESRGEAPMVKRVEEAPTATQGNERSGTSGLLELVLRRENLQAALKRVKKNKGSPGIDGMTVDADPYAGWCGRGPEGLPRAPMPIGRPR